MFESVFGFLLSSLSSAFAQMANFDIIPGVLSLLSFFIVFHVLHVVMDVFTIQLNGYVEQRTESYIAQRRVQAAQKRAGKNKD